MCHCRAQKSEQNSIIDTSGVAEFGQLEQSGFTGGMIFKAPRGPMRRCDALVGGGRYELHSKVTLLACVQVDDDTVYDVQ